MQKFLKTVWGVVLFGISAFVVMMVLTPLPASAAKANTFIALLNAGQEVPPTTSNAMGNAVLTLGDDDMLCVSLTFDGLESEQIAAHVHGPADIGVNANVLFPLPNGSPFNTCVGPLDKDQRKDLRRGLFYINVHTEVNPGGELRGQILPIKR